MNRCCRAWLCACVAFGLLAAVLGALAAGEARKDAQAEKWAAAVQWEAQAWVERMGQE
jgi:hypothetical protein